LRWVAGHFKMSGVTRAKGNLPFFPIFLNIARRKCLVVGAGRIAAEKIADLSEHGADIVVIAPRAERPIQKQAQAGKLAWIERTFLPTDVKGAFLVVAATNSSAVNGEVFKACQAEQVLCNSVDDPEHCDFFYPAVVRRGPLQIAISTNGHSPALASRLRKELEQQFGEEWTSWVEHIGKLRRELLTQNVSREERRRRLLAFATPQAFREFRKCRKAGVSKTLKSSAH
jgi:siroheme synthase-like protein